MSEALYVILSFHHYSDGFKKYIYIYIKNLEDQNKNCSIIAIQNTTVLYRAVIEHIDRSQFYIRCIYIAVIELRMMHYIACAKAYLPL